MTSLKDLRLFTTQPHNCSYLDGQQAQTLFIDPDFQVDKTTNSQLSELGFRRSGSHIYRPNCRHCQQCLSCRVLVANFTPSRRFTRILQRNADLTVSEVPSIKTDECYLLYKHYITVRHADGDMYPPSREQYASFLLRKCEGTHYYTLRHGEQLLGVMVSDELDTGFSAVYTFYDPLQGARSLGTFGILWQIGEARRRGLAHLYLGYWIRGARKMRYKIDFRPLEMLVRQQWVLIE
ncbi:MAG: arginyltransferase [Pseudomonadales bacterium]|jgi:arginine-tRNA-protein transferase|nr:arginyltransferase [Pseudomonadales bacterium]